MSAIRASVAHHHMVDIKIATHWSYDFLGGLHVVTGAHLFVIIRQVVSCAARQNQQVYGTATEKHADMHLDYDSQKGGNWRRDPIQQSLVGPLSIASQKRQTRALFIPRGKFVQNAQGPSSLSMGEGILGHDREAGGVSL
jgi:hypothetical protein